MNTQHDWDEDKVYDVDKGVKYAMELLAYFRKGVNDG